MKIQDVKETFRILSYQPHIFPIVFPDIDTKPESLPHFTLPLIDQKPQGPFRIEYFPTFRGEIESVNMTYVIPPARIEK